MVRPAVDLTVAELEKMLNARRNTLRDLNSRRAKIQKELAKVDDEIRALNGTERSGGRGRRSKNKLSLRETVLELLQKNKKGHTLADLSQIILDAGYKTASTNFRNVLYQCLYNTNGIYHDEESGTYRYQEPVAKIKPTMITSIK